MPHPYGLERWTAGESPTDFGYTSQRNERDFGLMDYNARYYSPVLGRFVSPDTIVPEPTSSGGFNRYRYVRNNPVRYMDPSGHFEEDAIRDYLEKNHDNPDEILEEWKNNKEWWDMLTLAEGGDILFGTFNTEIGAGNGFMYQFLGEGLTRLDGIQRLDGNGNPAPQLDEFMFNREVTLEDINSPGGIAARSSGLLQFPTQKFDWVGLVRFDVGTEPRIQTFNGYNWVGGRPRGVQTNGIPYTIGVLSSALTAMFTGGRGGSPNSPSGVAATVGKAGVGGGIGAILGRKMISALNVEQDNRYVWAGGERFTFNHTDRWIMERGPR